MNIDLDIKQLKHSRFALVFKLQNFKERLIFNTAPKRNALSQRQYKEDKRDGFGRVINPTFPSFIEVRDLNEYAFKPLIYIFYNFIINQSVVTLIFNEFVPKNIYSNSFII